MHLRPDHHQRRHHPSIAYGSWSRCLHRFWHQFRWTRDQTNKNVLFPHTPTSVHPSVAYHRVLTRFGEGFGPVATRLLQRASRRGTEVSPRPVVRCLTGCCTSDPASPSHGQCDWSNSHWAPLIHGSAPSYLARFFTPVSAIAGRSQLRAASTGVLFVPRSHTLTIIGPRAFAISAPSAWNRLPVDLRDPSHSLLTFRKKLKTYLFNAPV